jgi:hypothetical protein
MKKPGIIRDDGGNQQLATGNMWEINDLRPNVWWEINDWRESPRLPWSD